MNLSLLHLPNELIFEILPYIQVGPFFIDERDFFNLSITCRHLYHALYPTILKHQLGILDHAEATGSLTILRPTAQDADTPRLGEEEVSEFGSEFFDTTQVYGSSLTQVDYISHTFSAPEIWSLHGLLVRSKRVENVSLILSARINQPSKEWIRGMAAVLVACATQIHGTLNVTGDCSFDGPVGDSAGPFSYTISEPAVYNLDAMSQAFNRPSGVTKKSPSFLHNAIGALKEFFYSYRSPSAANLQPEPDMSPSSVTDSIFTSIKSTPKKSDLSSNSFRGNSKVSHIELHSNGMFSALYYPFTITLLNQACIRSLSLFDLKLKLYDWNQILPSLTIPTLSHLAVGNSQIAFPDLFTFLQRHPSITILDLSHNTAIGRLVLPRSSTLLPALEKLIASPEYIIPFLEDGKAFPTLEAITITQETELQGQRFPFSQFDVVFRLISKRVARVAISSLSLRLVREEGILDWLVSGSSYFSPPTALTSVTRLEFHLKGFFCPHPRKHVVQWLSMFPALSDVVLDNVFSVTEWEADKVAIWGKCPSLRSAELQFGVFYRNKDM